MKQDIKNKKVYIILSICIFALSILLVSRTMQNDTFFTIKIGNDVFENGMSRMDNLTIHENIEFIHLRWAFDAIITVLYNLLGFKGIYFFVAIYTGIIGVTFFNILLKKKNNIALAFIFTMLIMMISNNSFTARAQIITYLIFIIEIYLIDIVIEKENKKDMFILSVLPLFIANFHASVLPMYFVLFLPYIAEFLIYKIENIFHKKEGKRAYDIGRVEACKINIKPLLFICIIGFVFGLCSPAFIDGYTYMFKCALGPSSLIINELKNITISTFYPVWIMFGILFLLLFIKDTKIKIRDLCMFFGLGFMAFLAARNTIFFYFIGTICLLNIIRESEYINELINKVKEKLISKKIEKMIILFTILVTGTICFSLIGVRLNEKYVDESIYPVKATKYIKENIDIENMRLFNHLNFGSYLELNDIPVFIDSRTEIYCIEFNPNSILIEWNMVKNGTQDYSYLFEKYNITHVLVYNTEIVNQYIKNDTSNYEKIYSDNCFTLYKKKYNSYELKNN